MISVVLVCVVMALMLRVILIRVPHPRELYYLWKLPGPWGLPIIGYALSIMALPPQGIEKLFRSLADKYKRLVGFTASGIVYVSLYQAEDIMRLLTDSTNISKGIEYECVSLYLGQGLTTSKGDQWRKDRRLMNGFFHLKMMEGAVPVMVKESQLLVHRLMESAGRPVDVIKYLLVTALNIVVETSAGIQLEESEKETMLALMTRAETKVIDRITRIWKISPLLYGLTKDYKEDLLLKKEADEYFYKYFNKKKADFLKRGPEEGLGQQTKTSDGKWKKCFIDQILEMHMAEPDQYTEEFFKDHAVTLMAAGHETSAVCCGFLLYLLALHPDIQERCYQEIMDVVGEGEVTMNNIKDLLYLDMVLKETLRLYPTVPYFSRTLVTDIVLDDGVVLPRGANVSVLPIVVHRNEKHFPDPERFDPDRFLPDQVAARHPYAYIPFSAGPRSCIGQKFSFLELKVIAAIILRRLKVQTLTKQEDIEFYTTITLKPTIPLMCCFIPR